MRRSSWSRGLVVVVGLCWSAPASSSPILAAPDDPTFSPSLGQLATGYQLQQDTFAALEFGLSLDVDMDPSEVATVQSFFAQTATTDFEAFSGKKPFSVVQTFNEYADIGNFGGIASVGVAARLIALKAQGGTMAEIAAARAAAVRAAQAWHVYATIGGPGVIARGIQRTTPLDPTTGPLPGALPTLTPLHDAKGKPLPNPKAAVWRAPVAPGHEGWIWLDDTSKDQVSGYALASAWLWDALVDDPAVDPAVTKDLADDLVAFAKALMKPAPEYDGIDLCIRDADGRLTDFHDLNPRQIEPTSVVAANSPLQNGFNAAMALGVIRAAYHVSGDPIVGQYYYGELVKNRGYPAFIADAGIIYLGAQTNYSNVNMLAISYGLLGRFETDPTLRATYAKLVESTFWSVEAGYDVESVQQAWYDAVYAGVSAHPTTTIRQRVADNLGGFPAPPAFYVDRVNCPPAAVDAGVCTGVDGMTMIKLVPGSAGHDGTVVAKTVLPMSIRPYSDFQWRSDPHEVNGTGASNQLDPGGDFLAAYWLSRVIDLDDPSKNVSPHPRAPYVAMDAGVDSGKSPEDAGRPHDDASSHSKSPPGSPSSCACQSPGAWSVAGGSVGWLGSLLGVASVLRRRRRRAR